MGENQGFRSPAILVGIGPPSLECGLTVLWSCFYAAGIELACTREANGNSLLYSSLIRLLKLTMKAFCVDLPGAM